MFLDTAFLQNDQLRLELERTAEGDPAKGWVPAYHFAICSPEGVPMGKCTLRAGHSPLTYYGGNIGYSVDEAYRGHRYARQASRLLFELARRHGMDYVIITCAPDNIPSRRTCEALGGRLLEVAELPADSDMRPRLTRVCVFRYELAEN